MKKSKRIPREIPNTALNVILTEEEFKGLLETLHVGFKRHGKGSVDIDAEFEAAVRKAKTTTARQRREQQGAFDREERALKSKERNVHIDYLLEHTKHLRKPFFIREPVAFLSLIVSLLTPVTTVVVNRTMPPAQERTIGNDDLLRDPYRFKTPIDPPDMKSSPLLPVPNRSAATDLGIPVEIERSSSLPISKSLPPEVRGCIVDALQSLNRGTPPDAVRQSIVKRLEQIRESENANLSEMESSKSVFVFSKMVETRQIQQITEMIYLFRSLVIVDRANPPTVPTYSADISPRTNNRS